MEARKNSNHDDSQKKTDGDTQETKNKVELEDLANDYLPLGLSRVIDKVDFQAALQLNDSYIIISLKDRKFKIDSKIGAGTVFFLVFVLVPIVIKYL